MTRMVSSVRLAAIVIAITIAAPAVLVLAIADPVTPTLRPTSTSAIADAARYLATNATTSLLIMLVAAAVPALAGRPHARSLLVGATDCLLTIALLPRLLAIGLAIGGSRQNGLPYFVHLPFELAALAIATGTYLHARRNRLTRTATLLLASALVVALLVLAAGLEGFATPRWEAA